MAPRVTLSQVAEATGVSAMTVSNVIRGRPGAADATRARVLTAVRELGYQPVATSRGAPAARGLVGVVMLDLTTQYALEILRGLADGLAETEHEVLVSATYQDSTREFERVEFLSSGVVDGIVLVAPEFEERTRNLLVERGRPFVVVDPRELEVPARRIVVDNRAGMRAATAHLLGLGHRRIGYLQGSPEFESSLARRDGFQDALRDAGLPADDRLVSTTDFVYSAGLRAAHGLLARRPRPTALVAGADVLAFAAIDAARHAGLAVPGDLSVVGFDDLPQAEYSFPGLTTVRQPLFEMGELAARVVKGTRPGGPERLSLPTSLVVRGTTAPPR